MYVHYNLPLRPRRTEITRGARPLTITLQSRDRRPVLADRQRRAGIVVDDDRFHSRARIIKLCERPQAPGELAGPTPGRNYHRERRLDLEHAQIIFARGLASATGPSELAEATTNPGIRRRNAGG